jgi:hypothetical protein
MTDTVRFFKDHTKTQFKAARTGDALAMMRLGVTTDMVAALTLQQAQHHVAVQAGYRSWGVLLTAAEHDRQLAMVMTIEPHLTQFGIGGGAFSRSAAERRETLRMGRDNLRQAADGVAEVTGWLIGNITPIRTINRNAHSYMGKHLVEDTIGRYVSNGEFIAAAIIAGYPYKKDRDGGLNVIFGMSNRDLRAARAARDRSSE